MVYIISMLAVVMVGFGTIVWRIRSAEQSEHNGDAGNMGDNEPKSSEGAYVYTSRKDDDSHRGNGRMQQYGGLQPARVYTRR